MRTETNWCTGHFIWSAACEGRREEDRHTQDRILQLRNTTTPVPVCTTYCTHSSINNTTHGCFISCVAVDYFWVWAPSTVGQTVQVLQILCNYQIVLLVSNVCIITVNQIQKPKPDSHGVIWAMMGMWIQTWSGLMTWLAQTHTTDDFWNNNQTNAVTFPASRHWQCSLSLLWPSCSMPLVIWTRILWRG